jgi:diguanylate cyclase
MAMGGVADARVEDGTAPLPRWMTRSFYAFVAVVYAVFVISTIPHVRPHPGYNLILDGWLNNIAYMVSPVVCWIRARQDATFRRCWSVLAFGLFLYGLGNVYWTIFDRPLDPEPYPSIADGLWLSFYGFAFVALVLTVRQMAERVPLSLWLDGIVGGLAVAAVTVAFVGPVLQLTGGSAAAVLTTLAYPLLDAVLLLVVTAQMAMFHWRPPVGLWFLAAGLVLFSVADVIYVNGAANNTYQPGGLNDSIWVAATLLMAFAPGWPKRPTGFVLPTWALTGIPVTATLIAVGLLVYHGPELHPIALWLAAATVVAALVRLIVSVREVTTLAHSRQLALTDELTGLGNRRAFYEKVESLISADGNVCPTGALLLLDLDRFKEVNDSLVHSAGDQLLCQVAARLSESLHDDDLMARLGGDEFAVFVMNVDSDVAEVVAERIRTELAPPFSVDGVTLRMDASVGIALYPEHGDEVSMLLRRADIAMYHAKGRRAGHSVYSTTSGGLGGEERLRFVEELHEAIHERHLTVYYQPKVVTRTADVSGVEALVRWEHPTRGLLFPDSFLSLAEESGLMRELTTAVMEQSLDQIKTWRLAGRDLSVAVNLSASSLVDLELPERVRQLLLMRLLPASALELEITEDFLMGDRERAREILTRLRGLGIRVAVDDFGTGYSSLAYLRELPIDELKLDRSFVQPMSVDPRAAAIVRSTIDLAHSLGMTLVAEGVEDEATAGHLASSGCDESQGFFFSRALPAAELERWLDQRPDRVPGYEGSAASPDGSRASTAAGTPAQARAAIPAAGGAPQPAGERDSYPTEVASMQ